MTSDVVLTAALRNNLLSLQNTQGLIDVTQYRLATGRKVNSALDNPQSFFAAQALNNRASDLSRLLDGLGQSIQVIKAADNGVTALTRLVEQADSVAQAARDALAQGQTEAKIGGDRDLRGIDDLTGLAGINDLGGDALVFQITDENGDPVNLGAYGGAAASTATVTIAALDSIDDLIAKINDLHLDDGNAQAEGEQAFEAKLDASGKLQIRTLNGGDFHLNFVSVADLDADNISVADALGFGGTARLIDDGTGNNNVELTSLADVALRSFALYDNSGATPQIAQASALLSVITDSSGVTSRFGSIDSTGDQYIISINGGAQQAIDLWDGNQAISIQSFVDQINGNTSLNTKLRATYDDTTGELSIRPIDGSVESIETIVTGGAVGDTALTANFGFGVNPDLTDGGGTPEAETIRLAASAADLAQLEGDFNRLRDQIDLLVEDTGYRGTNLLNGDDLLTVFNEFRTSSLTTNGVTFTADGLGLDEADFSRTDTVDGALAQVRDALETLRAFGSTLANDLAVIQARQGFTQDLVNTLKEGSDKLTVADQNEEGAKLLALQTRQQLGVTSLSLASQSQQSILRLF